MRVPRGVFDSTRTIAAEWLKASGASRPRARLIERDHVLHLCSGHCDCGETYRSCSMQLVHQGFNNDEENTQLKLSVTNVPISMSERRICTVSIKRAERMNNPAAERRPKERININDYSNGNLSKQ